MNALIKSYEFIFTKLYINHSLYINIYLIKKSLFQDFETIFYITCHDNLNVLPFVNEQIKSN